MHEINARIKELRTALNISQKDFGAPIAMSRSVVSNFEYNITEPSDIQISLICREYNVNEDWLRTGKGEMFNPQTVDDRLIEVFARLAATAGDSYVKQLVAALADLSPDEWEMVEKFARKVVENTKKHEKQKKEE